MRSSECAVNTLLEGQSPYTVTHRQGGCKVALELREIQGDIAESGSMRVALDFA